MENQEKAKIYDNLIYESDYLQRVNSKLKSEYTGNIPENVQKQIDENNAKIAIIVGKLENLFR
jgi:flagellar biosynthesis chaperone FliJ